MADKPTVADPNATLPDWTPVEGEVTEPSGAKKADGWNASDVPPASMFNWFWKRGYQWLQYLDAHTEVFQSGSNLLDTAVNAALARLSIPGHDPASLGKTRLFSFSYGGSEAQTVSVYLVSDWDSNSGDHALAIASNAEWDGTDWNYSDAAELTASLFVFGSHRFGFYSFNGADGWADAAWDVSFSTPGNYAGTGGTILEFFRTIRASTRNGNASLAEQPAFEVTPDNTLPNRTLVLKAGVWRIYYASNTSNPLTDAALELTNAEYDNAADDWTPNTGGSGVCMIRLNRTDVDIYQHAYGGGAAFVDADWLPTDFRTLTPDRQNGLTRWTALHWSEAINASDIGTPDASVASVAPGTQGLIFRLPLPGGAKLKTIRVDGDDDGGNSNPLEVIEHDYSNVQTGNIGNTIATVENHTWGDTSNVRKTFDQAITQTTDHDGEDQTRYLIKVASDFAVTALVYGIAIEWEDPNPARY